MVTTKEQSKGARAAQPQRVIGVGLLIQLVGAVGDLLWHASHPGIEGASTILWLHAPIYLGILLVGITAVRVTTGAFSGVRGTSVYVAIAAGALTQATGSVWDFFAHGRGYESSIAHLLVYVGAALAVIGFTVLKASRSRGLRRFLLKASQSRPARKLIRAVPYIPPSLIFSLLPSAYRPGRGGGGTGLMEICITGLGAGTWTMDLSGDALRVIVGPAPEKPATRMTLDSKTWTQMVTRRLDGPEAFMRGKLAVEGDLALTLKLGACFP